MKNKLTDLLSEQDLERCTINAPLYFTSGEEEIINIRQASIISVRFDSAFYRSATTILTDFYKPISQC